MSHGAVVAVLFHLIISKWMIEIYEAYIFSLLNIVYCLAFHVTPLSVSKDYNLSYPKFRLRQALADISDVPKKEAAAVSSPLHQ